MYPQPYYPYQYQQQSKGPSGDFKGWIYVDNNFSLMTCCTLVLLKNDNVLDLQLKKKKKHFNKCDILRLNALRKLHLIH